MSFVRLMMVVLASATSIPPFLHALQPPWRVIGSYIPKESGLQLWIDLPRELNDSLEHIGPQTRQSFLLGVVVPSVVIPTTFCAIEGSILPCANAFDGGVGGLGKTKPQTGVQYFGETSGPIQSDKGIVTAEIQSISGKPVLVSFQTPWPISKSSAGLEARDLRNSESAFLQVVSTPSNNGNNWKDKNIFEQLLLRSVLSSTGKFGAYGQPFNIQVKPLVNKNEDNNSSNSQQQQQQQQQQLFSVTFTTLTPAMRESERKVWIQSKQVDSDTLVLLVTGTTAVRFPPNESVFRMVVDSFQAIKAPESKLR
jgi:hypothetical protein